MKLLICLALAFAVFSCAASSRRPASDKPETKPDYLALLGSRFFDGPGVVALEGTGRPAKIFLPKNYEAKDKWPLVLQLHGYTSFSDETNFYLGLGSRVTERGYVLLTPDGIRNSKGDRFWNATDFCCDFEKSGVDDVQYLLGLVEKVASTYKIDRDRIYLYGHSNGGFMGNRLLCETEGVFAGMVNLAGATFKEPSKCRIKEPVSRPRLQRDEAFRKAARHERERSDGSACLQWPPREAPLRAGRWLRHGGLQRG